MLDIINEPSHYHRNSIDVIKFSELQFDKKELQGFYRINILKYVTRFDRKNKVEDLKKAQFYLDKLIKLNEPIINNIGDINNIMRDSN